MHERPILFSDPMVRALLAGTKTQTRRVVKPGGWTPLSSDYTGRMRLRTSPEPIGLQAYFEHPASESWHGVRCPFGQTGDRLWVREVFARIDGQTQHWIETDYRATYTHGDRLGDTLGIKKRWTPSIHMPRHVSRITLEITDVRVERLQDISEADARAEGVRPLRAPQNGRNWGGPNRFTVDLGDCISGNAPTSRECYRMLWESINGEGRWDANPWVWVVGFQSVDATSFT